MGFDVKITTFLRPLDLIAPFTCRGCGRLGELLCECCKNYNIKVMPKICPRCRKNQKKCCCEVPVYAVAYREGPVMKLTEDFKYKSIRKTAMTLAELMNCAIPCDLREAVVVPLPTISRHIRERGFDHTKLLAKKLCKMRPGFELEPVITRLGKNVQVGADAKTREAQAKQAYAVERKLDPNKLYLLIDDVWTTGSSMNAAIAAMQKAGAKRIASAVMLMSR